MVNEFRAFCEKPPKGFEKYFKEGGKEAPKEVKDVPKQAKGAEAPKQEPKVPPPPSRSSPSPKPYEQWSFGLFGGTGSR